MTLQIASLGASYGSNQILSEVSTPPIPFGNIVSVVGPNAAGKSTLFKRIAGLVQGPGDVIIDKTKENREPTISYMPQISYSTARISVFESIALALKQGSSKWKLSGSELERVDAILQSIQIENLAFKNIGDLSGGQLQLVSLAQTLIRDPDIVLMDEPTSALDMRRQIQVLDYIRELANGQNKLIFIAIHDLNHALRFSDLCMVISGGSLAAFGKSDIVINSSMLRNIYGVSARVEETSIGFKQVLVESIV